LFPNGSESTELHEHIQRLEVKLSGMSEKIRDFKTPLDSIKVKAIINDIDNIRISLSEANSFVTCLLAQNPREQNAMKLKEKTSTMSARFDFVVKNIRKIVGGIDSPLLEELLETENLSEYTFILQEWHKQAKTRLPENEEKLISDLMVNGYHAWSQVYHSLISSIKVSVQIDGETREFSVGQAIHLRSHPDETVRKEAHYALEEVWQEKEVLFAQVLNHLAGFRLQVYKKRGRENVLEEALVQNRMNEGTLHAMWTAISKYKHSFVNYLNQKAKITGDEKMQSYNFWAPVTNSNQKIEYEEAVSFILTHFSQFGTVLETFARMAFEHNWIEAEDRPNKSPAAFCAGFPLSGESRIFMTYGNRMNDVLTLAHELGHAFHNHTMKPVKGMNRYYPMSVAETASAFAEMIILDAAIEQADSTEERLFFLDEKLKRSVMNFMNIHARFLFEKKFYEERKNGIVPSTRLNEMMNDAFNEGYDGSFENYSVHSWIWTPHFYNTNSSFYNFPYTFGYLFSLSIYQKSKEIGKGFEKQYIELLRDSGSMSMEDLVMKHLKEDLTSEDFWERGIKACVKDAEDFIRLLGHRESFEEVIK